MDNLFIRTHHDLKITLIKHYVIIRSAWRTLCLLQYVILTLLIIPLIFNPLAKKLPALRTIASFLYRRCYHALNIKLVLKGQPVQQPALWICNHISWIDILLLAGNHTVDFIAKTEVGHWPFIGSIIKRTGTLLIDRGNKFQAYRSLPLLQHRIKTGIPVVVFPEGTTSEGKSTLPFKPMFYQAAIREKLLIQPISLHYLNSQGEITDSVAFIDDDDFGTSLKRILKQPQITAVMHFLPPISAMEYDRKELAKLNQNDIEQQISQYQFHRPNQTQNT